MATRDSTIAQPGIPNGKGKGKTNAIQAHLSLLGSILIVLRFPWDGVDHKMNVITHMQVNYVLIYRLFVQQSLLLAFVKRNVPSFWFFHCVIVWIPTKTSFLSPHSKLNRARATQYIVVWYNSKLWICTYAVATSFAQGKRSRSSAIVLQFV